MLYNWVTNGVKRNALHLGYKWSEVKCFTPGLPKSEAKVFTTGLQTE